MPRLRYPQTSLIALRGTATALKSAAGTLALPAGTEGLPSWNVTPGGQPFRLSPQACGIASLLSL